MKTTPVILFGTGFGLLFIWCGITDRNPVAVLKAVLTGQPIPGPGETGRAVGSGAADAARAGANATVKPPPPAIPNRNFE